MIADEFDKRIEEIAKSRDRIIRKSAIDMFSEIIERTPVKEGIARNNWQTEIDNIPNDYDMSLKDKQGSAAKNKMSSALSSKMNPKQWKDYTIYFVNNLPYIRRLEYGWSTLQAPEGMVRLTVARFNKIFTEALKSGK